MGDGGCRSRSGEMDGDPVRQEGGGGGGADGVTERAATERRGVKGLYPGIETTRRPCPCDRRRSAPLREGR
jgi:hypothetical protein